MGNRHSNLSCDEGGRDTEWRQNIPDMLRGQGRSRTLLPFFAQGDLGSSPTSARLCDVRGGQRADQWQLLFSQGIGCWFTTRYRTTWPPMEKCTMECFVLFCSVFLFFFFF